MVKFDHYFGVAARAQTDAFEVLTRQLSIVINLSVERHPGIIESLHRLMAAFYVQDRKAGMPQYAVRQFLDSMSIWPPVGYFFKHFFNSPRGLLTKCASNSTHHNLLHYV